MKERLITHYCSCIADNPELQKEVFSTAREINEAISKQTHEFASKHSISPFDFQTKLIIDENGNQHVVEWCSNRSSHVAGLIEAYQELTKGQLKLYDEAIKKAHEKANEIHIKNETQQIDPSSGVKPSN
jgi:hypothetical protein